MSDSLKGTFTGTTHALTEAMETLALAMPKKTADEIITQQGRLFARDAIRITPPRSKSQGQKRVSADIAKAVRVLKPQDFTNKRIVKAIRNKDAPALLNIFRHIRRNGGFSAGLAGLRLLKTEVTNAGQMADAHRKSRDSRGRIRRTVATHFTFTASVFNSYVKNVRSHVGMAKGGWVAGYLSLGGKPAQWIATHRSMGIAEDGRKKPGLGSYFLFINRAPWATDKNSERVRDAALRTRAQKMKAQAEHIIRGEMKRLERQMARAIPKTQATA